MTKYYFMLKLTRCTPAVVGRGGGGDFYYNNIILWGGGTCPLDKEEVST